MGVVRIIDLSVPLKPELSLANPPQIEYHRHEETPSTVGAYLGLEPADFPGGRYCAHETVTAGTHVGTHLD
ncbi:cyclase family protein, partial [Chloroflexota bacterium]